jgi:acyl-CoA thioesterase-1
MPSSRPSITSLTKLLEEHRPVTWLFAGDSITQGAVHTRGWRDYTQLFKERLGEMARNEDVVINSAVGGWWLQSLLPRVDERILHFQPDAVFLMFGTNDATGGKDKLEQYRRTYCEIIRQLRNAGVAAICMQTTVPMLPVDPQGMTAMGRYPSEQVREAKLAGLRDRLAWIKEYVQATRDLAGQLDLALIDHYSAWEKVGGQRGQLMDGGFHPNEYGHRLIARTIFRELGMWDAERSWTCRLFLPADPSE